MACRRFILLGASNVALAFPRLIHGLCESAGDEIEIFAAFGHGRSYGLESSVLGRRLSGLQQCRLWEVLAAEPPRSAQALLTDVGNDLLYGVPVKTLVAWVEDCVRRLEAAGARSTLTLPPAVSVANLPPWRYALLRRLLFPGNRDSLDLTRRRLEDLRGQLERLAGLYGLHTVASKEAWFGFDPIHIRPRVQGPVWGEILADWPTPDELPWPGWRAAGRLWRLAPETRQLWGKSRRSAQPHILERGGKVHLF